MQEMRGYELCRDGSEGEPQVVVSVGCNDARGVMERAESRKIVRQCRP